MKLHEAKDQYIISFRPGPTITTKKDSIAGNYSINITSRQLLHKTTVNVFFCVQL